MNKLRNKKLKKILENKEKLKELFENALKINREMKLEICAIDFLIDEKNFKFCEVNSVPGFNQLNEFSANINFADAFLFYCLSLFYGDYLS